MIVFVADIPSFEDVETGEPLVGPGGQLFSRLLRMAGLARTDDPPSSFRPDMRKHGLRPLLWARSDHLVTNVWNQKIEGNDLSGLFAGAKEAGEGGYAQDEHKAIGYGWLRPEHRLALERIRADLIKANPDVIVPLGAGALWAFTGSTAITEARGIPVRASRVVPGVKIVPTLHPSSVLTDYRMLGVVAADLRRAAEESKDRDKILYRTARELWIEPSLPDLDLWWLDYGMASGLLAVDIETNRGQVTCIGFAADTMHSICVPFVDYRKSDRSYWPTQGEEARAWAWVSKVLGSPIPKVMQNGLYDVAYLWGKLGLRVMNYCHDTRLMHHVLQPELPKSLAFLGSTYAHPPLSWKTMREVGADMEKREA